MTTSKSICVIDDDLIFQYITKKIIDKNQLFSTVTCFENGREAMEYFQKNSNPDHLPDIILLDINMPEMDGWAFMDELNKEDFLSNKDTAIYISTSSIAKEDRDKAAGYPKILGYLCKPISREMLQELSLKHL